ncbi:MAG: DUF1318 domain-containing protein, partial [Nitrospirae bacterium]
MRQLAKLSLAAAAGLTAAALAAPPPAAAMVRHLYIAASDGYAYVPQHNGYPGNPA